MTCTRCRRAEEIHHAPYSGQRLCRGCFLDFTERRVKKTISKHSMLRRDDRIAVAVSGGKDSVALLHILHKLEQNYPS
ncbi:MAG: TIGR00269 family protein, partial [Candidatus Bathyarchaeia archaeon]